MAQIRRLLAKGANTSLPLKRFTTCAPKPNTPSLRHIPYNQQNLPQIVERLKKGEVAIASFPLFTTAEGKEAIKKQMGYVEEHWNQNAHTACIYWDPALNRFNAATIMGARLGDSPSRSALTVGFQQPYRGFAVWNTQIVTNEKLYNQYQPDINMVRFNDAQHSLFLKILDTERKTSQQAINEIKSSRKSERGETRIDDKTSEAAMEDRKKAGYF